MKEAGSASELVAAARAARLGAKAMYSGFQVGAALVDSAGRVFTGSNIESSSYGLSLCAERVAIFKALSEGAQKIVRVAVVADTPRLTSPCGACRQILWDFCPEAELILANLGSERETMTVAEILPKAFDASFL